MQKNTTTMQHHNIVDKTSVSVLICSKLWRMIKDMIAYCMTEKNRGYHKGSLAAILGKKIACRKYTYE